MKPMPSNIAVLPDALREALGQVVAKARQDWQRERELIEAQSRQAIAELRAQIVELEVSVKQSVAERLASLKDGEQGPPGAKGDPGERGPQGERGEKGDPGERGEAGFKGDPGERGPAGGDGKDGERGEAGAKGEKGDIGEKGERGIEGPAGKLPVIKTWAEGVHYEGDVVAHNGASYQALKDTGHEPPGDGWLCIAGRGSDGADGRSFTIRGTWKTGTDYSALDVVSLNGGSFVAKKDNPGDCPGDDWQLIARQGKTGEPGQRGERGQKGEDGKPGAPLSAADLNDEGLFVLTSADGSAVVCDFYPLLSKLAR